MKKTQKTVNQREDKFLSLVLQIDWLSYYREETAVFCNLWTAFKQKEKSPFGYNTESEGFNNWKKALKKF